MDSGPRSHYGIDGKVAVVTGSARNIGRATALLLANAGVRVGLVAQSRSEHLTQAAAACDAFAPSHAVVADLGDPSQIRAAADEIESELGPVDIVVNNAGIRPRVPIDQITVEEWDRVIAVNLRAPFLAIQRFLPGMIERRWGRIINVSGLDAIWGSHHRVHVTTSKGGLIGLTTSLTPQVAKYGITINTVVPGAIDTERHTPGWYPKLEDMYSTLSSRIPAARFGSPEEVAQVIAFTASELSSYVNGQTLNVTGGSPILRQREHEDEPDVDWAGGNPEQWQKALDGSA